MWLYIDLVLYMCKMFSLSVTTLEINTYFKCHYEYNIKMIYCVSSICANNKKNNNNNNKHFLVKQAHFNKPGHFSAVQNLFSVIKFRK